MGSARPLSRGGSPAEGVTNGVSLSVVAEGCTTPIRSRRTTHLGEGNPFPFDDAEYPSMVHVPSVTLLVTAQFGKFSVLGRSGDETSFGHWGGRCMLGGDRPPRDQWGQPRLICDNQAK